MTYRKFFTTSLSVALIVSVFSMSPTSPFLQVVKPAMAAGTLTSVAVIPTNNIVNTRTTYDIFFKTATTGTIKTVEMKFPFQFDVSVATKLIERTGIDPGSLSNPTGTTLVYTVNSPVSVPAGTSIRIEIGRIVNGNVPGAFAVEIKTKDEGGNVIDGPTFTAPYTLKSITGDDVSGFMKHKLITDDAAGHLHGWNPDGSKTSFSIDDSDLAGQISSIHVSAEINSGLCAVHYSLGTPTNAFGIQCAKAPIEGSSIDYIIIKQPQQLVTS